LDPLPLEGQCFRNMEIALKGFLDKANNAANKMNNRVVLIGILPTISKKELELEFMTPNPRYHALNEMIRTLKGNDISLYIRGNDELSILHDSVLFEACNTSFQMHLQIRPDDFIASYNWAQAISGPLLGIATNSPLLLGRELWSETRIALFQQSLDTRTSSYALKEQDARVTFGNSWAHTSVVEMFKNDIARHKIILHKDIDKNSLEELEQGRAPKLQALNLHNGTIYHWNRACYGVENGKAHVRIENRYLPAGPSTPDEIANFAFWVGMMSGRPAEFDDMSNQMDFKDAKLNFIKTARTGKESMLQWQDELVSVQDLVIKNLLPIAHTGLKKAQVNPEDIEYYLGIIEKRTHKSTGAQWCISNYRDLNKLHKKDDSLTMITKAVYKNQQTDLPVHEWPPVDRELEAHEAAYLVSHIMSTDLLTLKVNDLAGLASSIMRWKNIHHLPVENNEGQLCGLLTWAHMKKYQDIGEDTDMLLVADIMIRDLLTVRPETEIKTAIYLMQRNEIGCLPVIQDRLLVGILTRNDIIPFLS
ncbi:MAG: CBS domain-containing protein, partial [Bacteroidota bacterium]|nr:CBS domain-containing protein [Bacteroidota bacterium]